MEFLSSKSYALRGNDTSLISLYTVSEVGRHITQEYVNRMKVWRCDRECSEGISVTDK
jgi:hypothetical protein